MSDKCPVCNGTIWPWVTNHKCNPEFLCGLPEWSYQGFVKVRARDAEAAAEEFACQEDAQSAEWSILDRGGCKVTVFDLEERKRLSFTVEASMEPVYVAHEVIHIS